MAELAWSDEPPDERGRVGDALDALPLGLAPDLPADALDEWSRLSSAVGLAQVRRPSRALTRATVARAAVASGARGSECCVHVRCSVGCTKTRPNGIASTWLWGCMVSWIPCGQQETYLARMSTGALRGENLALKSGGRNKANAREASIVMRLKGSETEAIHGVKRNTNASSLALSVSERGTGAPSRELASLLVPPRRWLRFQPPCLPKT